MTFSAFCTNANRFFPPATVSTTKADIAGILTKQARIARKRNLKAALRQVRLSINGRVEIESTDYDCSIVDYVAYGDKSGFSSTMVDPRQLKKAIGTSKSVELSADCDSVTVNGIRLASTVGADEFPEFHDTSDYELIECCSLSADEFKQLAEFCAVATDSDSESSRYALGGVCIEFSQGAVDFVGTDGRRLHRVSVDDIDASDEVRAIVPTDTIKRVIESTKNRDLVQIKLYRRIRVVDESADENADSDDSAVLDPDSIDLVQFDVDAFDGRSRALMTRVTSRVIEGRFPKWRDVLPTPPCVATVDVKDVLGELQALSALTTDDSRGVSFYTDKAADTGNLFLMCSIGDSVKLIGKAVESTAVELDCRFLQQLLKVLKTGQIDFHATDGEHATLWQSGRFQAVVMPLVKK